MSAFEWDDENRGHIALHGVSPEEVEEALMGPALEADTYTVGHEQRFEEIGQTVNGRILKMVATLRDDKVRIVTAYVATRHLKTAYLQFLRSYYE